MKQNNYGTLVQTTVGGLHLPFKVEFRPWTELNA